MKISRRGLSPRRSSWTAAALLAVSAAAAHAAQITVVTSGAFTAAYKELAPEYERATHNHLLSEFGASMGTTHDAIPMRLERGEAIDVVIMASDALDDLIRQGKVQAGSRVDLVRSRIAMAVKAGARKPDISTVDALKRALLEAKSIAYSDSASGVYLSTVLFPKLGVAEQIKAKSHRIDGTPVGEAVARGDAEIGFQQISELMPVKGIDIAGPLPEGAQKITIFAAGITVSSRQPEAAKALIEWLASPVARRAISKSGLDPVTAR